jgi:hypothetical protein
MCKAMPNPYGCQGRTDHSPAPPCSPRSRFAGPGRRLDLVWSSTWGGQPTQPPGSTPSIESPPVSPPPTPQAPQAFCGGLPKRPGGTPACDAPRRGHVGSGPPDDGIPADTRSGHGTASRHSQPVHQRTPRATSVVRGSLIGIPQVSSGLLPSKRDATVVPPPAPPEAQEVRDAHPLISAESRRVDIDRVGRGGRSYGRGGSVSEEIRCPN